MRYALPLPQPSTLDSKEMYKLYCAENKAKPFCALASISKKPPATPKAAAPKPTVTVSATPQPSAAAAAVAKKVPGKAAGKGPGKGAGKGVGKGAGKKAAPTAGARRLDEEVEVQIQAPA